MAARLKDVPVPVRSASRAGAARKSPAGGPRARSAAARGARKGSRRKSRSRADPQAAIIAAA